MPGNHLLETLQPPSATVEQLLPHPQDHVCFGLQQQPVLNLALESSLPIQPPALSPVGEYTFNLHQGRSAEQQMHVVAYDSLPSSSRAATFAMAPPPEHKPSPPVPISPAVKGNPSGNDAQSAASRPRREASNVVIACRQCRARKIRCDSTRPHCNNCIRRGNDCEYDAKPKRRGPDKRPGTRQRSCKKRPPEADPPTSNAKKRRKIEDDDDGSSVGFDERVGTTNGAKRPSLVPAAHIPDEATGLRMPQAPPLVLDTSAQARGMSSEVIYPKDGLSPLAQHSPVYPYHTIDYPAGRHIAHSPMSPDHCQEEPRHQIPTAPSFDYAIETWWDSLLTTYAGSREESFQAILDDVKFLLDSSSYWLFFFNRQILFRDLHHMHTRPTLQPALVLSALALSTLMRSSELECGAQGRARAVSLRNSAQAALEAACHARHVDMRLAEASIILAIFESSSHPEHSQSRADEALQFMDSIILALKLPMTDMNDPDACIYSPRTIPMVFHPAGYASPEMCSCIRSATTAPSMASAVPPQHYSFSFAFNPPWDPNWADVDIVKEESRRICWSALNLIANYTAQSVAFHQSPLDLGLMEPSNYCILFPGEAYERNPRHRIPGQSPKDSVWALYCRSMLLWISAIRPRDTWTNDERADFAIAAWTETRMVQDGINMHKCNLDTAVMYISREYLYNTRLEITSEFRRSLQDPATIGAPLFNRRQAQEWLYYQDQVAQRVKNAVLEVGEKRGHLLTRRPFQSLWFASQVSICLALWGYDRSLLQALELGKTFLIPLDTLDALWPCPVQRTRTETLRDRLREACLQAGIATPLSTHVTLPPMLRSA
ncbi:uncharacterized protein PHACADRAFT_258850 [Phanerochaete carnosa HHB-10118-sp]|uniref:Zn(2)-C6 fungal-type domain-containing protein n=1 Tax=Phanerochaete carnosa (strain HHB-10118-sp) TaxID=650164 RepID=K5W743_PHACS|nr:uncharacterized protein PHACADRAFT_258850 [Phanerochaete carnosa HHB-10118-sp]EKM54774.1 hypothetical protein PHACADRAFT_258850 [Phanerochaete carnosa HHB-10118-sp]